MMNYTISSVDFFGNLDLHLNAEQFTLQLQERYTAFLAAKQEAESHFRLSEADTRALRSCVTYPKPNVRGVAFSMLCRSGIMEWGDLDSWVAHQRRHLREVPFISIAYGADAVCDLCESDIRHCALLFDKVFAGNSRFSDVDFNRTMNVGLSDSRELLEATWRGTGIMLDMGRRYVTTPITVGYLEEVLVYKHQPLLPDDPLLRSWIDGRSIERKMALLSVIQWFGMRKPGQLQIATALAADRNAVVRRVAWKFLNGEGVQDILSRWWA